MTEPYIKIPLTVLQDTRLLDSEKILLGQITALCNKTGECWAGNKALAETLNMAPRSITRGLTRLNECGYTNVVYKGSGNTGRVITTIDTDGEGIDMQGHTIDTDGENHRHACLGTIDTGGEGISIDNNLDNKKSIHDANFLQMVNEVVPSVVPKAPAEQGELLQDLPDELQTTVNEWLEYKKERREGYKPTGYRKLVSQLKTSADTFGCDAVVNAISQSIASGYRGIVWPKPQYVPAGKPPEKSPKVWESL